jgi:hypothetical protein
MGLGDWLKQWFNPSTGLCERCSERLAPAAGSHFGERAATASQAIAAHGCLVRRAWRSAYVQEGGEDLYQCRDCGSWWGHVFWTCVPQEALYRYRVRSVEGWVKKWPKGEVVP